MKTITRMILFGFLTLLCRSLTAETLTVMAFETPGYSRNASTDFDDQWNTFVNAWTIAGRSAAQLQRITPVEPLSGVGLDGVNISTAVENATLNNQTIKDKRNAVAADIVVVYAAATGLCGEVRGVGFLLGLGSPNGALNIDTQFSDGDYVIVITDQSGCEQYNSVLVGHEAVHIFGGTHALRASAGDDPGILSNDRANAFTFLECSGSVEPICFFHGTMGASNEADGVQLIVDSYSSPSHPQGYGDSEHNNEAAVNLTADSVAHYRIAEPEPEPDPPPPEDDFIFPPGGLDGSVTSQCVNTGDGLWTVHNLSWLGALSSFPQSVIHYEVWFSQPDGNPYTFGWVTADGVTSTPVWVIGADSRIKLKACVTGFGCSTLSSESYLARYLC